VTRIREKRNELSVLENRGRDCNIVDLPGSLPGIVRDQNVPWREFVRRKHGEKMFHRCRHGVDVARRAADGLGNHSSFSVEHAAGKILAFAHDGAERRANQRVLLLVAYRQQPVPNHFQSDGINDFASHR
jgi:hypothetical protein